MKSRVFTIGGILFLGVAAAVIALVSLISGEGALTKSQPVEAQTTERPNFVFVMTDDLDERAMQDLGGIRTLMGSNGTPGVPRHPR
jgi:hypothetical protein